MKNKIYLVLMSIMLTFSMMACKTNTSTTEKTVSNEVTEEATSAAEMSTEYNELDIKTDWEAMANITFSDTGISIDGNGATVEGNELTITEGGAYTLSGDSNNCSVIINTDENVKLILNGVDLTSTSGPVIYGLQVKNLYIEMAEGTENTLTDCEEYATDASTGEVIGKAVISCEDDLIILGEGTLNINGNYKHGISADDKLYIEAGNINIQTIGTDGLHANDLICIDGGILDISAPSDIMESEDMIVINGGTITGTSEDEGIESKNSLYINGGKIQIEASDDALNAASYLEINGGELTINCQIGDAIDCNGGYDGCIVINGGTINAIGGKTPEGGIDADNSMAFINGGEIIVTGDVNSPLSNEGKQVTVVYGTFNANETIEIKDSNDKTVFSTTPTVSGSTMIISSASLNLNESYKIYANGQEVISFTADATVVEAGGSANGMGGMGEPGMQKGPMENGQLQEGEGPRGERPRR